MTSVLKGWEHHQRCSILVIHCRAVWILHDRVNHLTEQETLSSNVIHARALRQGSAFVKPVSGPFILQLTIILAA